SRPQRLRDPLERIVLGVARITPINPLAVGTSLRCHSKGGAIVGVSEYPQGIRDAGDTSCRVNANRRSDSIDRSRYLPTQFVVAKGDGIIGQRAIDTRQFSCAKAWK